jgi:hypothetical protein
VLEAVPLNRILSVLLKYVVRSLADPVNVRTAVPEPLDVTPPEVTFPKELDNVGVAPVGPPATRRITVSDSSPLATAFENFTSPFVDATVKDAGSERIKLLTVIVPTEAAERFPAGSTR